MLNDIEYSFKINKHFLPIWDNTDRYLILWGGRGSSKTDCIAKKLITRCYSNEYFRFILVRNNYNSIKDSQYQTIKDLITDAGLENDFEFKLQPLEIICKHNGNKFIARGCDDTTKLKSVKDPTGAWYEEDIPSESDFITITTSIRTQKASYLQEIFTINPEVEGNFEDNWFWKRFFEGRAEKSFSGVKTMKIGNDEVDITYTSHHSTYHHNKWLPLEFKAFLEDLQNTNPYYYTIYTLGEWGNKDVGGTFYKDFNRAKHLTWRLYEKHLPLHISFDFNVRPYTTLTVWQVHGHEAIQIDEVIGKEPNNRPVGVCKLFKEKYPLHDAGLFVYGDPSGKSDSTKSEKGSNEYDIIHRELVNYRPRFRIAEVAPSVTGRGGFINAIFRGNEQGLSILIHKSCSYTIMDYSYGKEAADGTKLKERVKDEITGIPSEKHHHCFTGSTLVKTIKGDVRIDSIKSGDYVLTRQGFRKVIRRLDRGVKTVKRYRIGGNEIESTKDHKILTGRGFISICYLMETDAFYIFTSWKNYLLLRLFYFKERNTIVTLNPLEGLIMFIINALMVNLTSIEMFGVFIMARSRKATIFTTLTEILLITPLKTLNAFLLKNITPGISTLKSIQPLDSLKPERQLNYGIQAKRVGNGIVSMLKIRLKTFWWYVPSAIKRLLSKQLDQLNFVHEGVKVDLMPEYGEQEKMVYDLMIEDVHEYFANNILVSNCTDANDYFLTIVFRKEFNNYLRGNRQRSYLTDEPRQEFNREI
jgi:PBSX family phage terminase large subunit